MIDKDTPDRIYAGYLIRRPKYPNIETWWNDNSLNQGVEYIKASKVNALVTALELAPEPVANPSYEYLEDWNMWFTAAMKALNEYKGTNNGKDSD